MKLGIGTYCYMWAIGFKFGAKTSEHVHQGWDGVDKDKLWGHGLLYPLIAPAITLRMNSLRSSR